MRVCVFGIQFQSKRALAKFLGCNYNYSPRRQFRVNITSKERLSERDIMERFNLPTKKIAQEWMKAKLKEAEKNASIDD